MTRKLSHLFLRNPQGISRNFPMSRNIDNDNIEEKPAESYRPQKDRLNICYQEFDIKRQERMNKRIIDMPAHIDYVKIHFYIVFGDNAQFKTKTKFESEFGLSPVMYSNFNKSVLFAIADERRFEGFIELLKNFVASPDNVLPKHQNYAIITTIHDFEFLSSEKILGYSRNRVILDIVNFHVSIWNDQEVIKSRLFQFLDLLRDEGRIERYNSDNDTSIEIEKISDDDLFLLVNNFDVLCAAHSLRHAVVRPDLNNIPDLTWGLSISSDRKNQIIGVLDNGFRPIEPLANILLLPGIDITSPASPNAAQAVHPHGTIVASLAAVGTQFFNDNQTEFVADANILPIKILQSFEGVFQIYDILNAIRTAVRTEGVRIFNLSVCAQGKIYNEEPSVFAYQLDRLAYELDILIFIATGNLDEGDLEVMQSPEFRDHPLHQYPNHFYDREDSTDCHTCEATNICSPSESLNNITVGAIADNLRADGQTDLTLSRELPAFYTRKNHYDYTGFINGTRIKQSQINRNISKPDIVMPGGDRLNPVSGMQVFGFGENGNDFFVYDSGSSLAAPLAANLAAKILNLYPTLNMQSVKSLIINSSKIGANSSFLENLELRMKNRLSQQKHHTNFENLSKEQKTKITKSIIRKEFLHRNIAGYGRPDENTLLYSNDKSATLILEDTIANRMHKVIPINIPRYLLERDLSKRLYIKATLCFKVFPTWGNHLDYNPLHISFNFARSLRKEDPNQTADIIALRNHSFYEQFYQTDEILAEADAEKVLKLKSQEKKKALGINKELKGWSEDYFPPVNKPFSNTQQSDIHINKDEIEKVSSQIVLVLRCALKENLPPAMQAWADRQQAHPFSITLTISDETKLFDDYSLYDNLTAVNRLIPIAEQYGEAEAAEAEAES